MGPWVARAPVGSEQMWLAHSQPHYATLLRPDFIINAMCCKFKMKTLGGFEKRSNTIQFTFKKISLLLLLCGEWIKKDRKLGMKRRARLHHISGRPAARLFKSVGVGLHVILGDASKPHSL